jgi:DNA topoisomerase-1
VAVRSGRFGRYLQLGEGDKPKRAPIPKDVAERLDLELALKLLHLPRSVGTHPETGLPVLAGIGRYGPYLLHDGKYARLGSTDEVFDIGMNLAVVRLAEKREPGRGRGAEPLKILGAHPESGGEVRLMPGRYGAYVTDGTTNATLPKALTPEVLTLEDAVRLLAEKAAKGGAKPARKLAKNGAKTPAKKHAAKTAPAKNAAPAKSAAKAPAKKTAARRRPAASEA